MSEIKEYKCPNCSGRLEFDSKSQQLKCPFCEGIFDPESFSDEQNMQVSAQVWHDGDILMYTCNSCGGSIMADEKTAASICPYCGSSMVVSDKVSGLLKPVKIIPFKYDKKQAKEKYREHLKGKTLLPKAFTSEAVIDEIKGIYVPYWLFGGKARAGLWFDAEKKRTWTEKDEECTEVSTYKVFRSGIVSFENVPVDASTDISDLISQSIEPFDVSEMKPFSANYLAGHYADRYDVDAKESRKIADQRIANSTIKLFDSTMKNYDTYRLSSKQVSIGNGKQEYVMFPIWLLNVEYQDKIYSFAMNGQTGKFVGDLPSDKKKLLYIRIAVFLAVFVLAVLFQLLRSGVL